VTAERPHGAFATTHWSLVLQASHDDSTVARDGPGNPMPRLLAGHPCLCPARRSGAGKCLGFAGRGVVNCVIGGPPLELDPGFAFPSVVLIAADGNLAMATGGDRHGYLWRAPSWEEFPRSEVSDAVAGW
jgi:hypothetical protein